MKPSTGNVCYIAHSFRLFTLKVIKGFIENCIEDGDKRYFFEVYIQYPEKLHELPNDLPVLLERMKIGKVEKLIATLHDKKVCHTLKKFETSTKSWISIEKSE